MAWVINEDCSLDRELVRAEFARASDGTLYLNTGSNGRKPLSVLRAVNDGWAKLNENPTHWTFFAEQLWEDARQTAASLLDVPEESLLLTQNATQGIQMILQSFLLKEGDELVTTSHEHGSLRTIARYLRETRAIVVREFDVDPWSGSQALCDGVLALVNSRTKLVALSEIFCYSGWRPKLNRLAASLEALSVPFLVDGAHALGHGIARPKRFPLWATSGHKWLGAPNGTGLLYVRPDYVERLQPTLIADRYYNEHANPLRKFEFPGTCDVVRWLGFKQAVDVYSKLGESAINARHRQLVSHLRAQLQTLPNAKIRTPDTDGETTAMLTVTWEPAQLKVDNLKTYLWDTEKIYTQLDYLYGPEGRGLRISCHVSVEESDLDRLVAALRPIIK